LRKIENKKSEEKQNNELIKMSF